MLLHLGHGRVLVFSGFYSLSSVDCSHRPLSLSVDVTSYFPLFLIWNHLKYLDSVVTVAFLILWSLWCSLLGSYLFTKQKHNDSSELSSFCDVAKGRWVLSRNAGGVTTVWELQSDFKSERRIWDDTNVAGCKGTWLNQWNLERSSTIVTPICRDRWISR